MTVLPPNRTVGGLPGWYVPGQGSPCPITPAGLRPQAAAIDSKQRVSRHRHQTIIRAGSPYPQTLAHDHRWRDLTRPLVEHVGQLIRSPKHAPSTCRETHIPAHGRKRRRTPTRRNRSSFSGHRPVAHAREGFPLAGTRRETPLVLFPEATLVLSCAPSCLGPHITPPWGLSSF